MRARCVFRPNRREPRQAAVEHFEVYRRTGHFSGWPANYGLWSWGNEIVVIFADGKLGRQGKLHARDRGHHFRPTQARSLDGGRTWTTASFPGVVPGGRNLSADEHVVPSLQSGPLIKDDDLGELKRPIDFLDPDIAIMMARTDVDGSAISWFYVSWDRCVSWMGPIRLKSLALKGLAARTDVLRLSSDHALFFMSCSKDDGSEGQCLVAETYNGGLTFAVKSYLPFSGDGYAIMPTSVLFGDGSILTVVRRGRGVQQDGWLEAYRSTDAGKTWCSAGIPVQSTGAGGNPASLVLLKDRRVCLVYGYRGASPGLQFKLSDDRGQTWSDAIDIRRDGGSFDLGYPRCVLNDDGVLVVLYYYNFGEERFIASSLVSLA